MPHARWSNIVPQTFQKVVATELSRDFAKASRVIRVPYFTEIKPTEIIVRNMYAGVNASDINYTAGAYRPNLQPPFDVGFEGLGQVMAVGEKVRGIDLDDYVLTQSFGTFSEYQVVASRNARAVPKPDVRYLPLEVSGVTASIALEQVLEPKPGETALVTAAAGGTGQFAVQLLKQQYGCKVVATCSSREKAEYLRSLGADRVINYKVEDVDAVLSNEFKNGLNVVYESVGGRMFDLSVKHLATRGRLGVIGNITGYKSGSSFGEAPPSEGADRLAAAEAARAGDADGSSQRAGFRAGSPIGSSLLWRSASVRGFFLPHFAKHIPAHFTSLRERVDAGTLVSEVDSAVFNGVESAPAAVNHLLSGESVGKVVICLAARTF
jgi:NADPH-dependent curcumin reductase CurA